MGTPAVTFRFGICTDQNLPWPTLRDHWRYFEELGFESLWDCDHYQQPSRPHGPYFEGWTLLSALAAVTTTARVGVLVSCNTFRHPALVAKMATTIDHVSQGRVEVGLGAGWYEPEHRSFGIQFPEPPELVSRFNESVQIIDSMLRNEVTTFAGRHYQLTEAPSRPLPLQRPRPPLTLGAHGPTMLGIVARYAERWNSHGTVDEIGERNRILDDHCHRIGRNPDEIVRSLYGWASLMPSDPWESVTSFELMIDSYSHVGINEFLVDAPRPDQFGVLEKIAADILSGTTS
jgi:alkanesulfonate monooxygenase SsuD/methylene tetrahydromethanopterin reductase-like flavin-dependent oxidoreductase (luciferase family)